MTMKIEVTVPEAEIQSGAAAQYLAAAMSAIGFSRGVTLPMPAAAPTALKDAWAVASQGYPELLTGNAPASPPTHAAPAEAEAMQAETPAKRERGKPSQGRARRTKEEIAEDEAADAADAAAPSVSEKPMISTGEERIDPTTEADAAQDAADEAAEAKATKPAELTHDDVRAALQKYLTAFGTPAAMEDGPKVLTMMFGADVAKVSAVPNDQASLAKAVAGIEEMLVKNPFKREAQL